MTVLLGRTEIVKVRMGHACHCAMQACAERSCYTVLLLLFL